MGIRSCLVCAAKGDGMDKACTLWAQMNSDVGKMWGAERLLSSGILCRHHCSSPALSPGDPLMVAPMVGS